MGYNGVLFFFLHLFGTITFFLSACVSNLPVSPFMSNMEGHISCSVIWVKPVASAVSQIYSLLSPLITLFIHFSSSTTSHYLTLAVLVSLIFSFFPYEFLPPLSLSITPFTIQHSYHPTECLFILCLRPMYSNNVVCVSSWPEQKTKQHSILAAAALHCSDLICKTRQSETQSVGESFSQSEGQAVSLSPRNPVCWSTQQLMTESEDQSVSTPASKLVGQVRPFQTDSQRTGQSVS